MLDFGIVLSECKRQLCCYVHFQTNTGGKGMNPFIPKIWVKYHHYCSSTRMALALDKSRGLICH